MNHSNDTARESDVLAALRQATATRHERLDSGLPLAAPDATLADYARHLHLLRAWLLPLDAWQQGFSDGPQGAAGIAAASHLALIDADLAEPALAPYASCAHVHTLQQPWPAQASAAYRWGVAYVVEGSQLGGAVLYKRLAERLAPHPLRYLRGAGEGGPGPRWRAFMAALREQVRSEGEVAEACAGACDAFDRILALAFDRH
ncbi:biliverdin-producing heme oxygenase [Massilia sp. Leaf139]|uniref:biliverdin-producing heme oxygenase n=1 Tax=Massilia sp. Leaf139 TaxID=1736272 RepID=UPI0006F7C4E7|nr:biliverdin-producing heme oxygenase [Massilia sp. Leaf139]KQQ88048.1 heme oxygenase [Massilia sp. Leaf139]